jgi:hypothetical protein
VTTRIVIVDPLTLIGRELARCIEHSPDLLLDIDYRHTADDDERQIAELGAVPALVPPLEPDDDLDGAGLVVVASDQATTRTGHIETLIARHPEITLVDVGRLPQLADLTTAATGPTVRASDRRHLRVAHPALAAAAEVLAALRELDPVRGSVAAVDPVSMFGREAIETLVHQAGRRMQGGEADHAIGGHVLAFNQVAVDAEVLTEEAAHLLPEFPLAVTRMLSGCFHGHLAHLVIELAEPVDDFEIREILDEHPRLVVVDPPVGLELVVDHDEVFVTRPQPTSDRRLVAMTCIVDGLRVGGALTAVEILRELTVH